MRRHGRFPVLFMVLVVLTCVFSSQADLAPSSPSTESDGASAPALTRDPTAEPTRKPVSQTPSPVGALSEGVNLDGSAPSAMTDQSDDDVPLDSPIASPTGAAPAGADQPDVDMPSAPPIASPAGAASEGIDLNPSAPSAPFTLTQAPSPPFAPIAPVVPVAPSSSGSATPAPSTPTPAPVAAPATSTPIPTARPIPRPTANPSLKPTSKPTSTSASPPTPRSTPSPTKEPMIDPTRKPTSNQTPEPTPKWTPAQSPTTSPTYPPTSLLTDSPALAGSSSPSSGLTSTMPTVVAEPIGGTTAAPSVPALAESPVPTSAFPVQGYKAFNATMTLTGFDIETLNTDARALWEAITSDTIAAEIRAVLGEEQIQKLEVVVTLVSQNLPLNRASGRTLTSTWGVIAVSHLCTRVRYRNLQEKEQELKFDTVVAIQSVVLNHDINRYIVGAFNEDSEQSAYLADLMTTEDPAFSSVRSLSVSPATNVISVSGRTNETGGFTQAEQGDGKAGLTAGIMIAGVAAIGFVAFLFLIRRRRGSRSTDSAPQSSQVEGVGIGEEGDGEHDFSSEIEVGARADLSSLGDPFPQEIADDDVERSSAVGSMSSGVSGNLSLDYDYQRAFRSGRSSEVVSETDSHTLVTNDDNTLEAEYGTLDPFEVEAPAGKLGLVLQTANDGAPFVHIVSNTSPLSGQVHVGDRLLSVDGKDVTTMRAKKGVLRLIASKQSNPVRRLVFARLSKRSYEAPTDEE